MDEASDRLRSTRRTQSAAPRAATPPRRDETEPVPDETPAYEPFDVARHVAGAHCERAAGGDGPIDGVGEGGTDAGAGAAASAVASAYRLGLLEGAVSALVRASESHALLGALAHWRGACDAAR